VFAPVMLDSLNSASNTTSMEPGFTGVFGELAIFVGRVDGIIVGCFDDGIDGDIDGGIDDSVDGSIDGGIDGSIDGGVDGGVDGDIDNCI